jgi:hypothetical protein
MARLIKAGAVSQYFNEQGYLGRVHEMHASVCYHCQCITEFRTSADFRREVQVCRKCMQEICEACSKKPCRPWIKVVDWQDEEDVIRRSLSRSGWAPGAVQLMVEEAYKRFWGHDIREWTGFPP